MAGNLKNIKNHIKSVGNIQKITNSMKLVAAARFLQAEKTLKQAKPLGQGALRFYDNTGVVKEDGKRLRHLVAVTSDRGLCGSCHYRVCKKAKQIMSQFDINVLCVGEKSRGIIAFDNPKVIFLVVNGIGHKSPTFLTGSKIAYHLMNARNYYQGILVFAQYKNMLAFNVNDIILHTVTTLHAAPGLIKYELEDDSLLSYIEFSHAALIFYSLCEAYVVELSSRINAMSSASKNAGQLKKRLQLQFNRLRQATVTRELIDIVSGAAVVTKH